METDNRKEQIIKAAIKRFAHFGIGKTTMNEIAEDSSITKGNIYYYFPDKNALITEVIKELLNQFDLLVKQKIITCTTTIETLEEIQGARKIFFEKYHMLHIFEGIDCSTGNDNLRQLAEYTNQYAIDLMVEVFKKGIERGEFKPFDVQETAELYVQANRGIFLANKDKSLKKITIDMELRESIHNKQLALARIFIKALSH